MQITFDTNNLTDTDRAVLRLVAENGWKRETYLVDAKFDGPAQTIDASDPVRDDSHLDGAVTTDNTPERDANGLPWDERIHASSKALNADGTWRAKRGVDRELMAQVEAELRQSEEVNEPEASDIEAEQVAVPAPPAPPAPEVPTAPLAPAVTQSAPAGSVVTTPSVPVAPSSAVSPFVALMKRVTTAQGAGKLTQPRVKELLESLDKKSIMDLRTDEDALASFAVLLDGEGV